MSLLNKSDHCQNLVLYFQVHQPRRLRATRFFDIGNTGLSRFDDELNRDITERVSRSCYLPANDLLLKLIKKNPEIRINFSISGVALEQFQEYTPEVIDSFRALADTGCVEFLAETYYHSLAFLLPGHEFEIQVLKHAELIEKLFNRRPTVFRNTELLYDDAIGKRIAALGFTGIFTDGVTQLLKNEKTPNQVYCHPEEKGLKIFLRNYMLSDDIAFRFSQPGHAFTAETYLGWLKDVPSFEKVIVLGMDYETFGEHHKKNTGIFSFMKKLLTLLPRSGGPQMILATEAAARIPASAPLSVAETVSWADQERDLSAWLGNDMQKDAFATLGKLEKTVKSLGNPEVLKQWRLLQTSDHFYYMSTKKGTDGTVHNYFSPFPSPYDAFINYMNILTDFSMQVSTRRSKKSVVANVRSSSPLQPVEA